MMKNCVNNGTEEIGFVTPTPDPRIRHLQQKLHGISIDHFNSFIVVCVISTNRTSDWKPFFSENISQIYIEQNIS